MYKGYTVGFQEVPDEISLILNISGCQNRCEDCHSKYLWDNDGAFQLEDDLPHLLKEYNGLISCVCFMGGDHNHQELLELCKYVKSNNLKICIYSGKDNVDFMIVPFVDYYKIGHYDKKYGGLDKKITNQIFYKIENGKLLNYTYKFSEKRRSKFENYRKSR